MFSKKKPTEKIQEKSSSTSSNSNSATASDNAGKNPGVHLHNVTAAGDINIINPHFHEEKLELLKPTELEQLKAKELEKLKTHYRLKREIQRLFGKPLDIEKSYINLNVIETKKKEKESSEQDDKKEKLFKDERLSSFEDLFGEKRAIAVGDLFKADKDSNKVPKRLLVQGRAGIGKTTFATYISYCWGTGTLWKGDFDWVCKITLRNLTQNSVYTDKTRSMQDIIHYECFPDLPLARFEQLWREKISVNPGKVLLILDGLDEITTITEDRTHPLHEGLRQLIWGDFSLIVTSRPYGLSNFPQDKRDLEIVGFTNENIEAYIQQFFGELAADQPTALAGQLKIQGKDLFEFLKGNPSIWGAAHIPITLNILCGICEGDQYKLKNCLTMTGLYQAMEGKLLEVDYRKKNDRIFSKMVAKEREIALKAHYEDALKFLGGLAFRGMREEALILQPTWIDEELKRVVGQSLEKKIALFERVSLLGFIKPTQESIDSREDTRGKPHEYLHYSFQEYCAAVYVASGIRNKNPEILEFVREQKFNPRYQLLWWFVGGLMKSSLATYLSLLQDPESDDLIGQYSLALQARIMEEAYDETNETNVKLLEPIRKKIQGEILSLYQGHQRGCQYKSLLVTVLPLSFQLMRTSGERDLAALIPLEGICDEKKQRSFWGDMRLATPRVLAYLLALLKDGYQDFGFDVSATIGRLGSAVVTPEILKELLMLLGDKDKNVRQGVAYAIGNLGAAAATPEVLEGLLALLENRNKYGYYAAEAIGILGFAAVTPEVLKRLMELLGNEDTDVRKNVLRAIGCFGPVIVTPEILQGLLTALRDKEREVCRKAAFAIGDLGPAAATPEILQRLLELLENEDTDVRKNVVRAIGCFGPVIVTPEILQGLLTALGDKERGVRKNAAFAIGDLGPAATTPEILQGLLTALGDKEKDVRINTTIAIAHLGLVAVTPEILQRLLVLLEDKESVVRSSAMYPIGKLGVVAAVPEVFQGLLASLRDQESVVRSSAVWAIEKLAPAAAAEILQDLVRLLGNEDEDVRSSAAKTVQTLGRQHFIAMYESWLKISTKEIASICLANLSHVIIAGYFGGRVQMQVLSKTPTTNICCGFMGKTPFRFEITPEQAQCLRQLVPQIIEAWKTKGEVLSGEELFKRYQALSSSSSTTLVESTSVRSSSNSSSSSNNRTPSPALLPAFTNTTTRQSSTDKQKTFEMDPQCQQLIDALKEARQNFTMESHGQTELTIIVDAEAVSGTVASKWLKECCELIEKHGKAYLAATPFNISSDEIFHLLTITAKSPQHKTKLEEFLKPLALFQGSANKATLDV